MIAVQVADIIAQFVVFLDFAGEDVLDLDAAVEMTEILGDNLLKLDKAFVRELIDAFPVVAEEYSPEAAETVRRIPHDFYLEEYLAEDDPVRLAELEAIRDAEPPMNLDESQIWGTKSSS